MSRAFMRGLHYGIVWLLPRISGKEKYGVRVYGVMYPERRWLLELSFPQCTEYSGFGYCSSIIVSGKKSWETWQVHRHISRESYLRIGVYGYILYLCAMMEKSNVDHVEGRVEGIEPEFCQRMHCILSSHPSFAQCEEHNKIKS